MNGIRSPAVTVNLARCSMSRPDSLTGVLIQTESGPATALIAPSSRRTQGSTCP